MDRRAHIKKLMALGAASVAPGSFTGLLARKPPRIVKAT